MLNFRVDRLIDVSCSSRGIVTRNTFWDKFVLKKIQDRMGGRLRFFACGSAPISEEVYSFCRAALGVHAYEAYGLTETCGAMIMTLPFDYIAGHTGTPLPCSMVKLIDVPDMDIIVSRDNAGEVNPTFFNYSICFNLIKLIISFFLIKDLCEGPQLHQGILQRPRTHGGVD